MPFPAHLAVLLIRQSEFEIHSNDGKLTVTNRRDALRPLRHAHEAEVRAPEPRERAAEQDGAEAHQEHGGAQRVRGVVVLAHGAQGEARAGALEEPPHDGHEPDAEIDGGVVAEQHGAQPGEAGKSVWFV